MAKGPAFPKVPGAAGPGAELLQRAMFALNSHRPHEAEQIADKILKVDPRHPQALNILGSALLMQDRVNDAIALLEPAARGGQHPEIDTQLAIALRRAGRHDDALARLKRATRRQPPHAAAFQRTRLAAGCAGTLRRGNRGATARSRSRADDVRSIDPARLCFSCSPRLLPTPRLPSRRALDISSRLLRGDLRHGQGASGDRRESKQPSNISAVA